MMNDYEIENTCRLKFAEAGDVYHLCTGENHPVIYHNDVEFVDAMNIHGISTFLFPDLKFYSFTLMDNHLHDLIEGPSDRIMEWFNVFRAMLVKHPSFKDACTLEARTFKISDLENMRNVIAYIARNGAIGRAGYTPFNYPWGSNRFFFNDEAKKRFEEKREAIKYVTFRKLAHRSGFSERGRIFVVDNYVSPLCCCDVDACEKFFVNPMQFFYRVARNVEVNREIAVTIGESIFFNDEELFPIICGWCRSEYNCTTPRDLSPDAKLIVAKKLHFDYNAGNKQICRLLRMNIITLETIFPRRQR